MSLRSLLEKASFKTKLLVLTNIALAFFLRFWQLESLFHWTLDEEYWAYIPHNIATGYHLPLIGGPISGTGVYTGPLFVWLLAPVFFIIRSNPIFIAATVSLLGVATTSLILLLPKNLLDTKTKLIAGALYATSVFAVIYDRKFWNASLAPILSLTSVLLVYLISKKPTKLKVACLAFIVTLSFHAHMTGLAILVFSLVSFFVYRINKKWLLQLFIWLAIFQTPLLLFDIRHDFLNTKALVKLITTPSQNQPTPTPFSTQFLSLLTSSTARAIHLPATDISNELTLCETLADKRSIPAIPFQLLSILVILVAIAKLKQKNPFAILFVTNIILVASYKLVSPGTFYTGQLSEYFFLPSLPSFLIILASVAASIYRKHPIPTISLIILILTINAKTVINLKHTNSYQQKSLTVQKVISDLEGKPFSLDVIGHECQIYGYRFLFTRLGVEPVQSYLDDRFGWLYQNNLPNKSPQKHVLINADSATIKIVDVNQQNN